MQRLLLQLLSAAVVILALLLWRSRVEIRAKDAALASRPAVQTKLEVQTKTVTVQGPERIVEKVVQGQVVERVVYKEAATITQEAEKNYDRAVTPSCPATPALPWRYAGILADPTAPTKLVGVRGGVTFWNRLDVGAAVRFSPGLVGQAEVGIRF